MLSPLGPNLGVTCAELRPVGRIWAPNWGLARTSAKPRTLEIAVKMQVFSVSSPQNWAGLDGSPGHVQSGATWDLLATVRTKLTPTETQHEEHASNEASSIMANTSTLQPCPASLLHVLTSFPCVRLLSKSTCHGFRCPFSGMMGRGGCLFDRKYGGYLYLFLFASPVCRCTNHTLLFSSFPAGIGAFVVLQDMRNKFVLGTPSPNSFLTRTDHNLAMLISGSTVTTVTPVTWQC